MPTPKAGSYHIRFSVTVTSWLDKKRKERGFDKVQDVVRNLVQQAYEREVEAKLADVTPFKKAA